MKTFTYFINEAKRNENLRNDIYAKLTAGSSKVPLTVIQRLTAMIQNKKVSLTAILSFAESFIKDKDLLNEIVSMLNSNFVNE
ncbi:hypothetical protein MA9V2_208 [Chryseobacterium phage MA9V-2]|nr:hypothetical protein MA9V2_208 [Chryseobacterium phage MA9V-2]